MYRERVENIPADSRVNIIRLNGHTSISIPMMTD